MTLPIVVAESRADLSKAIKEMTKAFKALAMNIRAEVRASQPLY